MFKNDRIITAEESGSPESYSSFCTASYSFRFSLRVFSRCPLTLSRSCGVRAPLVEEVHNEPPVLILQKSGEAVPHG